MEYLLSHRSVDVYESSLHIAGRHLNTISHTAYTHTYTYTCMCVYTYVYIYGMFDMCQIRHILDL